MQDETTNWEIGVKLGFVARDGLGGEVVKALRRSHEPLTTAEVVNELAGSSLSEADESRRQIRNALYNLERSGIAKALRDRTTLKWIIRQDADTEAADFTFPATL